MGETVAFCTYLNFPQLSRAYFENNVLEVQMKLIIDSGLTFRPDLSDFTQVYYDIEVNSKNVVSVIQLYRLQDSELVPIAKLMNGELLTTSNESVKTFPSQKKLCQEFMRILTDLSKESLILLIGFDCSLGKYSKLSKVIDTSGKNTHHEIKIMQNTPKRKNEEVLKQTSVLPNVFFVDALLMLYDTLDKTESRIIQTPTVGEYFHAICEK